MEIHLQNHRQTSRMELHLDLKIFINKIKNLL